MDEDVAAIARATAARFDERVAMEVEAALHDPVTPRYADPVAIVGLIVSIASLAWTIYRDLRQDKLDREALARHVRVEVAKTQAITPTIEQVIDAVVAETLDHVTES